MSKRKIFKAPIKPISSRALEAGRSRSDSPDGPKTKKSGPDPVPANPSASREKLERWATRGTYGPLFIGSSPSAVLQSSLENRLRARMDGTGSPEYAMIWKDWDMPSGPPICALRALKRRIADKGCTGWPTPNSGPQNDTDTKWPERRRRAQEKHGNNGFGMTLGMASQLAPWPTPTQDDPNNGTRKSGQFQSLTRIAGWTTSQTQEPDGPPRPSRSRTNRKTEYLGRQVSGLPPKSSPAPTGKADGSLLNHRFSLWLQGFPDAWASCGERVGRSSRRLRRNS